MLFQGSLLEKEHLPFLLILHIYKEMDKKLRN